ncbi:MAG TPA: NAD(P)H-dependent oxidoreductase [Dehalococcoidia bacterium]|jgi:FMN reductase|nr:NAD(P)H-dependent oxidoreductase [Dehalococcoidia bacterium]
MSQATTPLAVAISGSPRSPSRSKALAELALNVLADNGCGRRLIDLAALPGDALLARAQAPELDDAIAAVGEARIVIAATPTYRALYTGLLKAFFDLMPPAHLRGKLCVPVQTGASPIHYLAVEYGLRPLFMSLDGIPLAGVYATDDEFSDGEPSLDLTERVRGLATQVLPLVTSAR